MHAKILAVLLRRESEPVPPVRLVHHAFGAGEEAATFQSAPVTAWQVSSLGAHREAASLYKTSLSVAHYLSAESQAELLEDLSFENYLIDNLEEAIRARERATLVWERLERDVRAGDCKGWLGRVKDIVEFNDQVEACRRICTSTPSRQSCTAIILRRVRAKVCLF